MFGDFKIADIIAFHCAKIDHECRQELRIGHIISERDYVSHLTSRIRREISSHFQIDCHAHKLPVIANNWQHMELDLGLSRGFEETAGILKQKLQNIGL